MANETTKGITAAKASNAVNLSTDDKEVLPMATELKTPVVTAAALAASPSVDADTALYEQVIEAPRSGKRSTDENSAFTQFKDFTHKMLRVALSKGHSQVRVGRLIQGAVDLGIFKEVTPADQRYRRGYNYFTQQKKSLPDGWVVQSVNGKNCCCYTKSLPKGK
jgi:hypothetical protein